MTAVAEELAFRSHVHPAQLTRCVRHRLVTELWTRQRMWMGLTFVYGMIAAMSVLLVCQWSNIEGMQREAVRPVLLGAGVFLVLIEIYFFRERRFVMTKPATAAMVIRKKEPAKYRDEVRAGIPRLLLRYVPGGDEWVDFAALHLPERCKNVWVDLSGFSSQFERAVQPGDLVTILYDPKMPERVRVVEVDSVVTRERAA